jgi:hypothetical protein
MDSDDSELSRIVARATTTTRFHAVTDPTYAELMGTYAELGELLATGGCDEWFEDDCRGLVGRLIALGKRWDAEMVQEVAAWSARQNIEREAA